MTTSVVEEANASLVGKNGACSDGGSREDECSSSKGIRAGVKIGSRGSS